MSAAEDEARIIDAYDAPPEETDATPPEITDADLAAVARKRHFRTDQIRRLSEPFNAEIDHLRDLIALMEADRDAAVREHQRHIDWYDAILTSYHRQRHGQTGEKTLRLPYGISLKARKAPDRVEIEDPAILPEGFRRLKVEADKRAVLAHLKATGEVLEGVTYIPGETKFTVATSETKEDE